MTIRVTFGPRTRVRVSFRPRQSPTPSALTTRDASKRLSQRTSTPRGAIYEIAGERYALYAIRRTGVVLVNVARPCACLDSACSGPFDPRRFTPPRG